MKTVCVVFNLNNRQQVVCNTFPAFMLTGNLTVFAQFKYLGHIIDDDLKDDSDVKRKIVTKIKSVY